MGRIAQLDLFGDDRSVGGGGFSLELLNLGTFAASSGLYSPSDVVETAEAHGANCGPASFAAIHRSSVREIMKFFPGFPERDWTTIGDMRRALLAARVAHFDSGKTLPDFGFALIQLISSDQPLHGLFSLAQTHWVGVCGGCFYDINWRGWLPVPVWEKIILHQFAFRGEPVRSWTVRNAIRIEEDRCRRPVTQGQTTPNRQRWTDGPLTY